MKRNISNFIICNNETINTNFLHNSFLLDSFLNKLSLYSLYPKTLIKYVESHEIQTCKQY